MTGIKVTSLLIIGIAGQIGSGKTSVATELRQRLGAGRISFGEFVRSKAVRRGVPIERHVLQDLGEQLIAESGPEAFARRVLDASLGEEEVAVLDGVRHVRVWLALQALAGRSLLVYLDVPEQTRVLRVRERDSLKQSALQSAIHHPMERSVPELKPIADLVVDCGAVDDIVGAIVDELRKKRFRA